MNTDTHTQWNKQILKDQLVEHGSFQPVADIYGVSRTRVRNVAYKLFDRAWVRTVIKRSHHTHVTCRHCQILFTKKRPHCAQGLCVRCYHIRYRIRPISTS